MRNRGSLNTNINGIKIMIMITPRIKNGHLQPPNALETTSPNTNPTATPTIALTLNNPRYIVFLLGGAQSIIIAGVRVMKAASPTPVSIRNINISQKV